MDVFEYWYECQECYEVVFVVDLILMFFDLFEVEILEVEIVVMQECVVIL